MHADEPYEEQSDNNCCAYIFLVNLADGFYDVSASVINKNTKNLWMDILSINLHLSVFF